MAAKPVKAPKTALTKTATFRRVSPKIASAYTPVQSNAFRMRATNAANRKQFATNKLQYKNPTANHNSYFAMYATLQRAQRSAILARQNSVARKASASQSLQLSQGDWARTQASYRSAKQQFRTIAKFGSLKSLRNQVTTAAGAGVPNVPVARVTVRTRNTSAAARAAQSRRAQIANTARKGTKYKKGGGSSGSGKTAAPKLPAVKQSRARTRTRTSHPTHAVATPKAAVNRVYEGESLHYWVTAGNDQGVNNCAAVAVANSLLFELGLKMDTSQVNMLMSYGETLPDLFRALKAGLFDNVRLAYWQRLPVSADFFSGHPGDVIVYENEFGVHASVLLPSRVVVSYGEEIPLAAPVLESWHLTWQTYSRFGKLWRRS